MSRGELRRGEVGGLAESDGGLVEGKTMDSRPEVQGITVRMAGEAVIDLPIQMDGEVSAGCWRTARDGTDAAKLGTPSARHWKPDQFQHLGHGDPLAKLAVVDACHKGLKRRDGYVVSGFGGSDAFLAR